MIVRGTIYDWYALPIFLALGVVAVVSFYWRFLVQWLNGIRGRGWPAVSATIDIVSVIKQENQTADGDTVDYLATLTYFYRNPDLQTGDYCRNFGGDEFGMASLAVIYSLGRWASLARYRLLRGN